MTDHPDDEKLDNSYAALTRETRNRERNSSIVTVLVAVAAVMVSASAVLSGWSLSELRKLAQEEVETRQLILLGTECDVEQMAEHRTLTALGHRADAAHHGYTYPIAPDNEPPPVPGVLENVCKTFLHTTTTSMGRR